MLKISTTYLDFDKEAMRKCTPKRSIAIIKNITSQSIMWIRYTVSGYPNDVRQLKVPFQRKKVNVCVLSQVQRRTTTFL